MLVRRERPEDHDAVRAVTVAAFAPSAPAGEEPLEAGLLDALRRDAGWIAELSLVAQDAGGSVVGHVVCTRGTLGGAPSLGLGPVSVLPDRQGTGVGSALMHAVLGAADALGEPVVVLLGHRDYYPRFGFVPAADLGIEAPDAAWGDHFQARPLATYDPQRTRGPFRYARPFEEL